MVRPDGGTIILDGADVEQVSVNSLRQRVSVIPQDTSLFDNTLRYNILYGNPSATETELQQAVDKSNLRGK